MKTSTLIVLVAATIVVGVGAAVVSTKGRAKERSEVATDKVFPDLAGKINAVEQLAVRKGDKEFTFKKGEAGWEVADKGGYPAKAEKIVEIVRTLSQIRVLEPKTSKPENYAKIGVEDPGSSKPSSPDAPASSSTLLTLKDGKGDTIAAVIVGSTRWDSKPSTYLRRSGEAQSWLADGRIDVPESFTGWVDAQLPNVPRSRMKSAELTFPDGSKTRVSREDKDAKFTVHDIPPGEELMYDTAGDTVGAALDYMAFEDVAPAGQVFPPPAGDDSVKPGPKGEFLTFDGLRVHVETVDKGGKLWAHILASFEETPMVEGQPAPEKKPEEVQKEVTDFNEKTAKWAFQLPDYKATTLRTTVGSLLKSKVPVPPPSLNAGNEAHLLNPESPPQPAPTGPP